MLPDALIEQYSFWQSADTQCFAPTDTHAGHVAPASVIVGYPRFTAKDRSKDPSKQLTFLFVRLYGDGSARDGTAVVKRADLQGWSERCAGAGELNPSEKDVFHRPSGGAEAPIS